MTTIDREELNKKEQKIIAAYLKQNEFDALVCHTYNTGGSNTLFKLVQMDADKDKIKSWWLEKYTTANGKKLQGLVNRRKKEWELYNK